MCPELTPTEKMQSYCNSLTSYSRLVTREVFIGDVPLGYPHPIRIQSMTTTDTMDTIKTVEQSIRIIEAGADYVRITAPSMNEAQNLLNIKNELRKRGYKTPLIADIHFTPNAAEAAARIVEKVRINPGNYADKKKFQTIEYTDVSYNSELERIRERFIPLIKVCREYGTAMRIGTNHGSLSDRIMSRYGDTPLGMVESALEFLRICEDEKYFNIALSMKASNPQVMVQAYRLLVLKMKEEMMNYPLHLGVTEAGDGEDGRIKSAVGIGSLLEDGLGDTIRVSLTEEPEFEIPVAIALVKRYEKRSGHQKIKDLEDATVKNAGYSFFEYNKRQSRSVLNIGGKNVPRVIADYSRKKEISPASLFAVGYNYSVSLDKWNLTDQACDFIFAGDLPADFEIPGSLGIIHTYELWEKNKDKERRFPLLSPAEYLSETERSPILNFIEVSSASLTSELLSCIKNDPTAVLIFHTDNSHAMPDLRKMFFELTDCNIPVIIKREYDLNNREEFQLHASTDCGGLLLDGLGDGLWLYGNFNHQAINQTGFGILQATRLRISKTEYISCPSCGRTLFDLQETTQKIRSVTNHLKGVKIAIMGCIVNGPGEMADADYGYVGTGVGKITLYKGKEVVMRNIPSEQAVNELIKLIKQNGDWIDLPR